MTIEKVKAEYGNPERNGYVSCDRCPLPKHFADIECDSSMTGFLDCWEKISNFLNEKEFFETPIEDIVNHPAHYTQGGIECIDAMKAAFGADELAVYCKIAAFKYIWRCEHKNGLEDVKKAVWYLNKYIDLKGGGTDDNKSD
jgi:hypothetical protein